MTPRAIGRPRVSVVMIFFNARKDLSEAIDSVLAQTFDDFELILVDDASTDGSGELARARATERIRYVERHENGGVALARNTGIAVARGEILCYADADDVQHPYRLAAQVSVLDRFPEAALVFSDFQTYSGGRVVAPSHLRARWLGPTIRPFDVEVKEAFSRVTTCAALGVPVPDAYLQRSVYFGRVPGLFALLHPAWGCATMARLAAVRHVGGHWDKTRAYEDWALASELAKRWPVAFLDVPTLLYRVHAGQLTGRARVNVESYRDVIRHVWQEDRAAYARHRQVVDRALGTALFQLGEVEAQDQRWEAAERCFLEALRSWPRLKRAYADLLLAGLRTRVPGLAGSALDRALPRLLRGRDWSGG